MTYGQNTTDSGNGLQFVACKLHWPYLLANLSKGICLSVTMCLCVIVGSVGRRSAAANDWISLSLRWLALSNQVDDARAYHNNRSERDLQTTLLYLTGLFTWFFSLGRSLSYAIDSSDELNETKSEIEREKTGDCARQNELAHFIMRAARHNNFL